MDVSIDMGNYHSIVWKILYFLCKIAPTCNNQAQELAQHNMKLGELHWKFFGCLVRYIKENTDKLYIKYWKPKEL